MRSVKIRLQGNFWDSQLYGSELLLFTDSNSILRVNWRALVDGVADKNPNLRTAVRVAFADGDLFYNQKVQRILRDPAITQIIKFQLSELADSDTVLRRASLTESFEVDSPFDFAPVDTDMYYSTLIACGPEGMFTASRADLGKSNVKERAVKYHDASFLQIRASQRHTAIASAAGADGLLEFPFVVGESKKKLEAAKILAQRACSACEWSFQSVMGWAPDSAFVARFTERRRPNSREKIRNFDRIYDINKLFSEADGYQSQKSFTWGSREKFYRLTAGGLEVGELHSDKKVANEDLAFDDFRVKNKSAVEYTLDDVVATATAPFGTVIELADRLIVMRSDGEVDVFPGEAVHWRIFPRSSHYSNQLHIIYDEYAEFISFVHDYFVDQSEKLYGFSRSSSSPIDAELADLW